MRYSIIFCLNDNRHESKTIWTNKAKAISYAIGVLACEDRKSKSYNHHYNIYDEKDNLVASGGWLCGDPINSRPFRVVK